MPTGHTAGMKKLFKLLLMWNTQKPTCIHILESADENFPSSANLYVHQAYLCLHVRSKYL